MTKWLVVLGFDDANEAREFADSVCVTGRVEAGGVHDSTHVYLSTVELGPYRADGDE